MSSDKSDKEKKPASSIETNRRKAVRRMLVGGGIISVGSQAPKKWTRPLVDNVLLPAHAQVSPVGAGSPTASPTSAPGAAPTTAPTAAPTSGPTAAPTTAPTGSPTAVP